MVPHKRCRPPCQRNGATRPDGSDAKKGELIDAYEDKFLDPSIAAQRGYLDAVIEPHDTRRKLSPQIADRGDTPYCSNHSNSSCIFSRYTAFLT
jgi:acetyl-CoA carboxylase carboxyltransferase component